MNSISQEQQLFAFHSCHQGASHKRIGKVCQDYAFSRCKPGDFYAIALVSDGHGSDDYFRSDRGAKYAVKKARTSIEHFMHTLKKGENTLSDERLRQLETSIVYRWRKKVEIDYRQHPFTEEEKNMMTEKARCRYEKEPDKFFVKAYGATLIAVVVYPGHFWFGLHIGDGKCVVQYADGHFDQPIPWDDKCFLNVTTSLCDERPLDNFRHCFHTENFPTAIFVGSDGVDDCFANDKDLYGFYREVIQTFRDKPYRKARKEVDEFLPVMSERGSGDDISVSGIILKGI